jgi:hypothetical protein
MTTYYFKTDECMRIGTDVHIVNACSGTITRIPDSFEFINSRMCNTKEIGEIIGVDV